jgi:hypothetical protein
LPWQSPGAIDKLLAGSRRGGGQRACCCARTLGAMWADLPAVRSFEAAAAQHGVAAVLAVVS